MKKIEFGKLQPRNRFKLDGTEYVKTAITPNPFYRDLQMNAFDISNAVYGDIFSDETVVEIEDDLYDWMFI